MKNQDWTWLVLLMGNKHIVIDFKDNVAVALKDLKKSEKVSLNDKEIVLLESIDRGHKFATKKIDENKNVIKYGHPIGKATKSIKEGELVHSHNLKTSLEGISTYEYNPIAKVELKSNLEKFENLTFNGYLRDNGKVGVRNELIVLPTVGCINGIIDNIVNNFKSLNDNLKIDDVIGYKHNYGCSQLGDDLKSTQRILSDIVLHPNTGGALILGLGCENNNLKEFIPYIGDYNNKRIKYINLQDVTDEYSLAQKYLEEIYLEMIKDERVELPISELNIGMKCGGSDGFSGITANPLLGEISDIITHLGGSVVLTEIPEMFGAEEVLLNRSTTEEVFNKFSKAINNFKEYFIKYDQPIYENPSPGNKDGGITTLEEKSLGCVRKGGTSKIVDVLDYGEPLKKKGLNILYGPGNDLVSSTALASSGCQVILFSTGRGTPFGTFVPTVKISTNSELYNNKENWIDFNAGKLLEGVDSEIIIEKLIEKLIRTANGELTNNEKNNFKNIAIFKNGVTL